MTNREKRVICCSVATTNHERVQEQQQYTRTTSPRIYQTASAETCAMTSLVIGWTSGMCLGGSEGSRFKYKIHSGFKIPELGEQSNGTRTISTKGRRMNPHRLCWLCFVFMKALVVSPVPSWIQKRVSIFDQEDEPKRRITQPPSKNILTFTPALKTGSG